MSKYVPIDIKFIFELLEEKEDDNEFQVEGPRYYIEYFIESHKKIIELYREFVENKTIDYLLSLKSKCGQTTQMTYKEAEKPYFLMMLPDKVKIIEYRLFDNHLKKIRTFLDHAMNFKNVDDVKTVFLSNFPEHTWSYPIEPFDSFSALETTEDLEPEETAITYYIKHFSEENELISYVNFIEQKLKDNIFSDLYTKYQERINDSSMENRPFLHALAFALYLENRSLLSLITYMINFTSDDFIINQDKFDLMLKEEAVESLFYDFCNTYSLENDIQKHLKSAQAAADQSKNLTEEQQENKKGVSTLQKIKEKVLAVPNITKAFTNKMRMFAQNTKSKTFYKFTLGKIEGLYKFYASAAQVEENQFKGDPVRLLKDVITPDIIRIGKEVAKLCDEVESLAKQVTGTPDPAKVIQIGENWAKNVPDLTKYGEKTDEIDIKKKIVLGTRTRLVDIIMKVNKEIYGFTRESCIVKKLPPPNIFVVAYLVEDFHQKPELRYVSDIFEGPDSWRIMASSDKSDIFQISQLTNAVIANKLNVQTFERIEERHNNMVGKISGFLKQKNKEDEEAAEIKKQAQKVMDGFEESLQVMFKQKLYVAEIINIYGNMIIRIDKLCVNAAKAMLSVEAEKSDAKFRGQMGAGKSLRNTSNTQNQNQSNRANM